MTKYITTSGVTTFGFFPAGLYVIGFAAPSSGGGWNGSTFTAQSQDAGGNATLPAWTGVPNNSATDGTYTSLAPTGDTPGLAMWLLDSNVRINVTGAVPTGVNVSIDRVKTAQG